MSDSTAVPDWSPGWFTRRGEPNPEVREAVRWMGGYDFPVSFLRSDEMVHPARPPQLGICIGNARHSEMELAVPPTYWIVRTPAGELRNWTDMDFKARWTRSDREWIPPRDREQPLATPTAMRKLKGECDVRVEAGSSPGSPEAMPAFQRALRDLDDDPKDGAERLARIEAEVPESLGKTALLDAGRPVEGAWKGTPPAEGSRRELIFDLLGRELGGFGNERCLELADEIESALLQSTIDDEAIELERFEKQEVRLDEICEERWKCIGDLENRLKRIYELATETGGPPRQLCDLHADLAEIAGIARPDYDAVKEAVEKVFDEDREEEGYDDSAEPLWKIEVDRGLNHARNAIRAWLGL